MSGIESILALGGPAGDAFAAAAGVTAALLLLCGPILLRAQRQRHQFLLTKASIERGVTQLPSGPPAWLQSARTGLILLSLGVALFICGIVTTGLSKGVAMPERLAAATQPSMQFQPDRPMLPPPEMMERGPHDRGMEGPPMDRMDRPFHGDRRPEDRQPPPPPQDPAMERWHRAQAEHVVGLTALACGFILSVMGVSRLLFSRVERRHEPLANDPVLKQ